MKTKSKYLNGLVAILILALQTPILIKAVTNFFIIRVLMLAENFNHLLSMSEMPFLSYEYLFKLVLSFTDFNFNLQKVINAISLFDILPLLVMILLYDINRTTKKDKDLNNALFTILLIYVLKYLGVSAIVFFILVLGLNIIIGLKYLAIWLFFIIVSFCASVIYLIWSFNQFVKNVDY